MEMNTKRDWTVGTKVEMTFGNMKGKTGVITSVNPKKVSVTVQLDESPLIEVEEGMMYINEIIEEEIAAAPTMTEKEEAVAEVIRGTMDSYGENFSDVDMPTLSALTGMNIRTIKGVLGSLHKKAYIFEEDINGENNVYYLTADGFKALTGEVPEYI